MHFIRDIRNALLHLAYPHVCEGCGNDLADSSQLLCLRCLNVLPITNFHLHAGNPVEKLFWGRLPVTHASAHLYFTKESLVQHLMHQFKYRNNKELGIYLGKIMGHALANSNRFRFIDALVPLPLYAAKERKRGFNQAAVLCEGLATVLHKPVLDGAVIRSMHTETQTRKSRVERWSNIEGKFELKDAAALSGKQILLVDDVITTGATLEACGRTLLAVENLQLSIATLCFSSH